MLAVITVGDFLLSLPTSGGINESGVSCGPDLARELLVLAGRAARGFCVLGFFSAFCGLQCRVLSVSKKSVRGALSLVSGLASSWKRRLEPDVFKSAIRPGTWNTGSQRCQ